MVPIPLDFRWHAFTLIAVFLALGIGIVIGVTVPQDRFVVEQQKDLLARLEEDFRRLRTENRRLLDENISLRRELTEQWAVLESLGSEVISGRLQGQKVLVLELGQVPGQKRAQVQGVLQQAGAHILSWDNSIPRSQPEWTEEIPQALLLVGGDLTENFWARSAALVQAIEELIALGIPAVVTGSGASVDVLAQHWPDLAVHYIYDLERIASRVELITALASPSMGDDGAGAGVP